MKRRHRVAAILACAIGLAASGTVSATPLVTIRVTSIDAVLQDIETIAKSAHSSTTRRKLLDQMAAALGVEDVSFLDLSRPAAIALPQDGMMLGPKGFVLAVPVRDGARALDVLAKQFAERALEGSLTVLRGAPVETEEGETPRTVYASLHGRILVVGGSPDLVRKFDHASALSGEGLPPGSLAFSMEIEPVAALLNGWLSATHQKLLQMPAPPVSSSTTKEGAQDEGGDPDAVVQEGPPAGGGSVGEEPIQVAGEVIAPELLSKVQPEYPEAARQARAQGKVILQAVIDEEGVVQNVVVLRSVPQLDDAAIDAVQQWKYKPATLHGRPVKVYFTVVVNFTLHDGTPAFATVPAVPGEPRSPFPFDPRKLAGLFDLYFGLLHDTIDAISKLQVSVEVNEGFLVVHARGVARQGSTLASFIAAQRDVGLPAIGRMMPIDASVIAAGQLYWTDPSRAWSKQLLQRYQAAMADLFKGMPEAQREAGRAVLQGMSLWSSDRILECRRGDIAFAMDNGPDAPSVLQVSGVSDAESCRGALASAVSTGSGGTSFLETEVLEPEKVETYVYKLRIPTTLDATEMAAPKEMKFRIAEVANLIISGTDPWASKAIREAASAREGSSPGGGGLLLTDLGPFTQRPGVFGRIQIGMFMRQVDATAKARSSGAPGLSQDLIQALEGPAGALPFATRFDEGAATVEFAVPLAMFDAFARNAPAPTPPAGGRSGP